MEIKKIEMLRTYDSHDTSKTEDFLSVAPKTLTGLHDGIPVDRVVFHTQIDSVHYS